MLANQAQQSYSSQSRVNWTLLKQLHKQGVKNPSTPYPDFSFQQQIQSHILNIVEKTMKPLLLKVQDSYKEEMSKISKNYQETFYKLQKRVQYLEKMFGKIEDASTRLIVEKSKNLNQNNYQNFNRSAKNNFNKNREKEFIYIDDDKNQQADYESQTIFRTNSKKNYPKLDLLDYTTNKKQYKGNETQYMHTKKQSRNLFNHDSQFSLNPRQNNRNYDFVSKNVQNEELSSQQLRLRREIADLRRLIQNAHEIKLEKIQNTIFQPTKFAFKEIQRESSQRPNQHLINENIQLRRIIQKYRIMLDGCQEHLDEVKMLLVTAENIQSVKRQAAL